MAAKAQGIKGYALEELLRAYFLRSGFFVIRGAPFQFEGENLTDIDLWLYERPTGTARRRQIVDAKSKTKPKSVERLLWTKGLAEALEVDGAYIATTDTRKALRKISRKLGVSLLDGSDIKRIRESSKVLYPERLTDEEIGELVKSVDKSRRTKELQLKLDDLKGAITENFGVSSIVRALDALAYFAETTIVAHPNSDTARLAGRLTYFSAAIVAISIDFVNVESPFQTTEERREMFINAVRYGATDRGVGLEKLRLSVGLIRQFVSNGAGVAKMVEQGFTKELDSIPAEIIADQAVRMAKDGALFSVGRELEHASFLKACPSFDALDSRAKALLGAFLDFCSIDRSAFANAWRTNETVGIEADASLPKNFPDCDDLGPLFKD